METPSEQCSYLNAEGEGSTILCSMNANQQPKQDITKGEAKKQPWTEAWEQAWEACQAQEKHGGDEKMASLRNRAKQVK